MWPWNHLALGYALYAGYVHLRYRRAPTGPAVIVLVVATQLPDLIDKPLAWVFAVLPSGLALGHSLLFALPVAAGAVLLAHLDGDVDPGEAFAIGYLSHLVGDLIYPFAASGELPVGFLFWPLVSSPRTEAPALVPTVARLWSKYVAFLSTPRGGLYLAAQVGFLLLVVGAWVYDGRPGLETIRRHLSWTPTADDRDPG